MTPYRQIDALNWSTLKVLFSSAMLYAYLAANPEQKKKRSFELGYAVHVAILEPERFLAEYVVKPKGLRLTTKAGKAWKKEHAHQTIVSNSDYEIAKRCVESLGDNHLAMERIWGEGVEREKVILWDADGIKRKARADAISRQTLADLKTCSDIGWFARDAGRLLYHGQLAWYRDGAVAVGLCDEDVECSLVAVETQPPFESSVFVLTESEIEGGRRLYQQLLDRLLVAQQTGRWTGRFPGLQRLNLASWVAGMEEL